MLKFKNENSFENEVNKDEGFGHNSGEAEDG